MQITDFQFAMAKDIQHPLLNKLASRLQNNEQGQGHDVTFAELKSALICDDIYDASVLVAITNEATPKVLLTRRASHINAHAGEVAFAGGKHEIEDGNNVITALRESYEETALNPHKVQIIGSLPKQKSKTGLSVRPIVALVEPNQTLVAEAGEIARIFWADLAWLIDAPTQDYQRDIVHEGKQLSLQTPSWEVEGETVWGLTGRVIASLLRIGFDRRIDWYYRVVVD